MFLEGLLEWEYQCGSVINVLIEQPPPPTPASGGQTANSPVGVGFGDFNLIFLLILYS